MKLYQPLFLAILATQLPLPAFSASHQPAAAGQQLFIYERMEGNFKDNFNIGGLTTGFSLILDDGREIQVDLLTNQLDQQFQEGARVRVSGPYKTVEFRGRRLQVLEAESVEFLETSLSGTLQIALPSVGSDAYYSLFLESGAAVQLDLTTNNFERLAKPGIEVLVNGYYKTLNGRQLFVVTAMAIS